MHPWTISLSLIGFTGAALGFGGTAKTAVPFAETLLAIAAALLLMVSLLGRFARPRAARVRKEVGRHRRKPRHAPGPSKISGTSGTSGTDAAADGVRHLPACGTGVKFRP